MVTTGIEALRRTWARIDGALGAAPWQCGADIVLLEHLARAMSVRKRAKIAER